MQSVENFSTVDHLAVRLGLGQLEPAQSDVPEDWAIEPELLQVLVAIVRDRHPRTIVEIGTYRGRTSAALAAQAKKNNFGTVYTVDNGPEENAVQARRLFDSEDLNAWIVQLEKSSLDAFAAWGRAQIDLLIIDGDHDYLGAVTDLSLWPRLLAPDGWIVVHDTVTRLLRRFPEDYVFPLEIYDIIDVRRVGCRPSGHEWEGAAFIRFNSAYRECRTCGTETPCALPW